MTVSHAFSGESIKTIDVMPDTTIAELKFSLERIAWTPSKYQSLNLLKDGSVVELLDNQSARAAGLAAGAEVLLIALPIEESGSQTLLVNAVVRAEAGQHADKMDVLVRFLLRAGANPNLLTGPGETVLHLAVRKQNLSMVQSLTEAGADPNVAGLWGRTPLHDTLCPNIALALLRARASLSKTDDNGDMPLHVCSNEGVVAALLRARASPDIPDHKGQTPLSLAVGRNDIALTKILLRAHARPDGMDLTGTTILHRAVCSDNVDLIKMLLLSRADPNKSGWGLKSQTLFQSIWEGPKSVVEALLSSRADLNDTSDGYVFTPAFPFTPLHWAASMGHAEVIQILVHAKADVHAMDGAGSTALHLASQASHSDGVKMLIDARVDANKLDADGSTALYKAAKSDRKDIFRLLLNARADPSMIDKAKGWSQLHLASYRGHSGVVSQLLHARADVNLATLERNGRGGATALHLAGTEIVARSLLQARADLNIKTKSGNTALCSARRIEIAALLLEAKADPRRRNSSGDFVFQRFHGILCDGSSTAAWQVARTGAMMESLLNARADPTRLMGTTISPKRAPIRKKPPLAQYRSRLANEGP